MLDGTWLPLSAILQGEMLPEETLNTMSLILADGMYTAIVGDVIDKGKIEVYPDTSPKEMNITGTEGPNKGRTILAIYDISQDSLTVCYNLKGGERPAEFSSTKRNGFYLVRYKKKLIRRNLTTTFFVPKSS